MQEFEKPFLKTFIAAIFLMLVISVPQISAAEHTVGVQEGKWIKYHVSLTWTGTGTEPSYITDQKNWDWMKATVKTISGTKVTMETSGAYKNGTAIQTSTSTVDVATGEGSGGGISILIAANLQEGDTIPQQYGTAPKINGTATRTYCNAMRSTNFLEISTSSSGTTGTTKAYWDKETGILVEAYMSMSTTTPTAQSYEMTIAATETDLWSGDVLGVMSNYIFYIAGIVVLLVVIVAVFLVLRRRKPATSTPSVAPTPAAAEEAKPT